MKIPLFLLSGIVLLSGCQTPQVVKELSKTTRSESAALMKAYEGDLDAMIAYEQARGASRAKLEANVARSTVNAAALLQAWEQLADREARLRALALWDESAFKLCQEEFPRFVLQEYFPRINTTLRPLRAQLHAAQRSAGTAADNPLMKLDETRTGARIAEIEHQAAAELITLYDHLHDEIVRSRAAFVKDVLRFADLRLTALPPPALSGPLDEPQGFDAAQDSNVKKLVQRKKEVVEAAAALAEAVQAEDFYLQSDGYARTLFKEAFTGLASGAVQGAKLGDRVKSLATSVGLSPTTAGDLSEQVTSFLKDGAKLRANDLFTALAGQVDTAMKGITDKIRSAASVSVAKIENKPSS